MQHATYYLGIDPGKSGGLAVVGPDGLMRELIKMPPTERDLLDWLRWLKSDPVTLGDVVGAVEWIHPAIKNIGKSPMSKLYGNYMSCRMALIASGIPFDTVMPAKWQRGIGVSKRGKTETPTQWKNRLKARAQELHPGEHITLATADALLIATFLQRLKLGQLGHGQGE